MISRRAHTYRHTHTKHQKKYFFLQTHTDAAVPQNLSLVSKEGQERGIFLLSSRQINGYGFFLWPHLYCMLWLLCQGSLPTSPKSGNRALRTCERFCYKHF
ncbi:UNVERIFIED_CONTAM: hypothetical protein K2H54_024614 [Gekko kuhli]